MLHFCYQLFDDYYLITKHSHGLPPRKWHHGLWKIHQIIFSVANLFGDYCIPTYVSLLYHCQLLDDYYLITKRNYGWAPRKLHHGLDVRSTKLSFLISSPFLTSDYYMTKMSSYIVVSCLMIIIWLPSAAMVCPPGNDTMGCEKSTNNIIIVNMRSTKMRYSPFPPKQLPQKSSFAWNHHHQYHHNSQSLFIYDISSLSSPLVLWTNEQSNSEQMYASKLCSPPYYKARLK